MENEGDAKKSRTLIELNSSLQIDIQAILEKSAEGFDMAKAESVFNLLEFNTLKKRLKSATQNTIKSNRRFLPLYNRIQIH